MKNCGILEVNDFCLPRAHETSNFWPSKVGRVIKATFFRVRQYHLTKKNASQEIFSVQFYRNLNIDFWNSGAEVFGSVLKPEFVVSDGSFWGNETVWIKTFYLLPMALVDHKTSNFFGPVKWAGLSEQPSACPLVVFEWKSFSQEVIEI